MLNPVPVNAAALIVTGAVPEEVNVTDCVTGVFRVTSPKATLLVPSVRLDVAAFNCSAYVAETPPALAVSVAVCAVLTAVAVAVNAALEAPAATVTEAGTVTALLLLARLTAVALVAAAVNFTVQASVPAPVSDALLHEAEASVAAACPVPLSAIVAVLEALLLIVTDPLTAPAVVGSKPIVSVAVWPGFRVIGALIPDTENPVPVTVAPLRMSSAVPEDVIVTDLLVAVFSSSVPNATLVALKLNPGVTAFSCSGQVAETPPALAVSVAVCAVLTAVAVAVKAALAAPDAMVTEAGAVTALSLLARLTTVALVAADVSVTVQASVTAPVSVALPQETALSVAGARPVPLSAIVPVLDALLPIVTDPLTAPAAVGSKPIVSVAVWPGFNVTGAVMPDPENPVPVTDTPLIVSAAVPEEVSVTDLLVAVFSNSDPNATLVVLRLSPGVTAFSCSGQVVETPPALAVSVAVCAVLTAEAVAVKAALEAPAAMVTEAGTVTALLLLARLTTVALVAADVSVAVHASVPAPVSDALLQETALRAGAAVCAACPVPLNAIVE
jgi:hypothetical protein